MCWPADYISLDVIGFDPNGGTTCCIVRIDLTRHHPFVSVLNLQFENLNLYVCTYDEENACKVNHPKYTYI